MEACLAGGFEETFTLRGAAQHGHTEIVEFLIGKGAEINAKNEPGMTALMIAAYNGQTASVKALIDGGADTNAKDKDGHTALKDVAKRGHTDVVDLLKKIGAKE